MVESMDGLIEVVDTASGIVQRVPRHFLDDPVLGLNLRATAAQKVLDGLQVPDADAKVADQRDFAEEAGIDLGDASTKADIALVISEALSGVLPAEPTPPPVAPEVQVEDVPAPPAYPTATTEPAAAETGDGENPSDADNPGAPGEEN